MEIDVRIIGVCVCLYVCLYGCQDVCSDYMSVLYDSDCRVVWIVGHCYMLYCSQDCVCSQCCVLFLRLLFVGVVCPVDYVVSC